MHAHHAALDTALASRDAETMRRALAGLPDDALHPAAPALMRIAADFEASDLLGDALLCRDLVVRAWPARAAPLLDRARLRMRMGLLRDALADCDAAIERDATLPGLASLRAQVLQALADSNAATTAANALPDQAGPNGADASGNPPSPPEPIRFDPALLVNPALPASIEAFRRDGIVQHLRRYSAQQQVRNALHRLQDEHWLQTWARALGVLRGRRVAMHGSGLGILALHALELGAERVRCIEPSAPAARIAAGLAHKHHLLAWHAQHGESVRAWDEARQRASFDAFAGSLEITTADAGPVQSADCDAFVFTEFDHTLLGTGFVPALRAFLADRGRDAILLPARATVHAMAVQWCDPDPATDLSVLRPLRWSPYPQPFDLPPQCWRAVTEATVVAEIDFALFSPGEHGIELEVIGDGTADAIVFWYRLELGEVVLSTAPDAACGLLRPAMQYIDPIAVRSGNRLPLRLRLEDTRLSLLGDPAPNALRDDTLPGWCLPYLADTMRDAAYGDAIAAAVRAQPVDRALNPGAGCGTLALALHRAGCAEVIAAEHAPSLARAGARLIAANAPKGGIRHLARDLRRIAIPDDMPARAGLAVFDTFDCSLIGEGILHYLAHAREHLLEPDARYLPASAVLHAQLIEHRFDRMLGIDATLLNPFLHAPGFIHVDAGRIPWTPLGDPFEVFRFDFATASPEPQRMRLDIETTRTGVAGAVLFWFDLQLDAHTQLSNAPCQQGGAHWRQGLQFLPEARVETGVRMPLVAGHDGSALTFGWDGDALDRTRLLPMPRFDPRTAMAAAELEQRTRELLQHCAQAPDERQRVADIAMRIAVDPAAHGVDPVIAQRFLSLLMGR